MTTQRPASRRRQQGMPSQGEPCGRPATTQLTNNLGIAKVFCDEHLLYLKQSWEILPLNFAAHFREERIAGQAQKPRKTLRRQKGDS